MAVKIIYGDDGVPRMSLGTTETMQVRKDFDAHAADAVIHITSEEREKWNDKYTKDEFDTTITSLSNFTEEVSDKIDSHTNNNENPHKVTKSQLGLGNVDNTADIDKPISTAVQKALDEKEDKANKVSVIDDDKVDDVTYPTTSAVKSYVDAINMNEQIFDGLNDISDIIIAHTHNESNPHNVTAEQLGLGNVDKQLIYVPTIQARL